jgi:hypothetical protein
MPAAAEGGHMMMNKYVPMEALHRSIRQTWLRLITPAFASRDRSLMLAALVLANTCLDELLRAEGYVGATSAERLQSAQRSFSNYEDVCAARRLRNAAVHHLDFRLTSAACEEALAALAQAVRDHGVHVGAALPLLVDERTCAMLPSPHEQRRQCRGYREHVNRGDAPDHVPPACAAI